MTAKRKIDLSVQERFYHHHHSDDFYEEKAPKNLQFKIKKQNLSKSCNISDWFDDEEDAFPLN